MAHRKRKYAAKYKQDKLDDLSYAGAEGRKAILADTTRGQWKNRIVTNVKGFWKAADARA